MINENDTVEEVESANQESVNPEDGQTSLHKQLESCLTLQAEWRERALRLNADLENYKKRMFKEQSLAMHRTQANILTQLLPILDNFERAMPHLKDNQGISMIYAAFQDVLKNSGVVEVAYTQFDPHIHEALLEVDSPNQTSGAIVAVLEKGYQLDDMILRPAKVSIAK